MLHTDIPCRSDIVALSNTRLPVCVSIYVPTTPVTVNAQADRIQFKNLVTEAVRQLEAADGLQRGAVAAIEESLLGLLDDGDFWAHQAHSLAVFATPERVITYRLPNQLSPVVNVADRFYLKPLLRSVSTPQSAYVLALAQGGVRIVEVSRDMPAYTVDVPGLPQDVASAVGQSSILDRSPEGRIQGSEGQKVRMRQYSRRIDAALRSLLAGQDVPLILASTAPLDAIFRSVCSYPALVAPQIEGNPEKLTDKDLAAAARPILDALHAQSVAAFAESFAARRAADLATGDMATAARAATLGAVETLLVNIEASVAGTVDEDTGAVQVTDGSGPETYGVLDEIARRALASGAEVMAVRSDEMPADAQEVAALLRFAL